MRFPLTFLILFYSCITADMFPKLEMSDLNYLFKFSKSSLFSVLCLHRFGVNVSSRSSASNFSSTLLAYCTYLFNRNSLSRSRNLAELLLELRSAIWREFLLISGLNVILATRASSFLSSCAFLIWLTFLSLVACTCL